MEMGIRDPEGVWKASSGNPVVGVYIPISIPMS